MSEFKKLINIKNNKYIYEWCSNCEQEVKILNNFNIQKCPNCKTEILPCCLCNMDIVNCLKCFFLNKLVKMASIDKIYINSIEKWREFFKWCTEHKDECFNKTKYNILNYFYETDENNVISWLDSNKKLRTSQFEKKRNIWLIGESHKEYKNIFYDEDSIKYFKEELKEYESTGYVHFEIPVSNFPQAIDRFLIQNCNIDWIQNRLKKSIYFL